MKKIGIGGFFMLCFLASGLAQTTYSIQGQVIDSLNKEALPYVRVGIVTADSLHRTIGVGFTEKDGKFSISNLPQGEYELKAFLMGYDIATQSLTIDKQSNLDIGIICLKKQSQQLEGVTIAAQKPVYMFDGEKTLYNVSEDPMIQTGTTSDALQNAPGVEVDIEGNITLRGVSSVEIWINDKPSNLNEEALKNFIQQMPAGSIDRIEVITNPSARYSSKGHGGIINIITNTKIKKNNFFSFGLQGSTTPFINPWISYVWANEKWSVSIYGNYNFSNTKSTSESNETILDENTDTANIYSQNSQTHYYQHRTGLFINASCEIDSMNSISFWGGTYPSFYKYNSNDTENREEFINNPGLYRYVTSSNLRNFYAGAYAGTWFTHNFNNEGHTISASINGSLFNQNNQGSMDRLYQEYDYLNFHKRTSQKDISYSFSSNLDYTIPYIENGQIEVGTELSYGDEKALSQRDSLVFNSDNEYQIDSLRFKDANFQQVSWAAYITLQHRFGGFVIKGGLRSELQNNQWLYLNSPKDNGTKMYWGLYPSIHLTYSSASMDNFKLSYTRRVSNPGSEELSTFKDYGEDSYWVGNPNLLPTYTHAIEAGWTKFIPKFGNISLDAYCNFNTNEMNTLHDVIFDPNIGRFIEFTTSANAGKSVNTGLSFLLSYQPKAFMRLRLYARAGYTKSQFLYRNETYIIDNFGYNIRLNYWAKLWKVLEVNISGNYNSKSKTLFMNTLPTYSIDFGLRAEFFKRLLAIHLNANNIFNWNKNSYTSTNPYFASESTTRSNWGSRYVSLGITFRFGRLELESMAARNNAPSINIAQ